ncbi:MAG: hypothetical protein ABIO02_02005 [Patescibacteria group bacterium]
MKSNYTPIHKHSHLHPVSKKQRSSSESITLFIIGFLLYIFVSLNIVASQQSVAPLYFSFVAEDRDAVEQTLHNTQSLEEFPDVLEMQRNIYGESIYDGIFKENKERLDSIQNLEQILQQNPKAREVLYALSVLYKEGNQPIKSQQYLQKAQEIDPLLR